MPNGSNKTPRGQGIFRALGQQNYRLYFTGQGLSLIGTWMTRIATSWLIYRLTGSAWMLGVIGFLGQIPTFLLGPFAGVWVDRWSRHRTLVWTQVLSMVQSFALGALAFSGHIAVWHVAALSVLQGIINAFDTPARQAFLIELVEDRAVLGNAIALNSTMVNVARLLGPSIGGAIIAVAGEAWCFTIDGISYGAVIASLLMMHLAGQAHTRKREEENLWRELREGFSYVARSVPIRAILMLLAVVSLVGMPYSVLLPIFARQIFHGGAHTLGMLLAATGVGALMAALTMAARRSILGLGRRIGLAAALFGAGLLVFALSRNLPLSLLMLMMTGFAMMQHMASCNTILQTISDPDKRGRVMSYYTMAFMGMTPFGSLFGGAMAARLGAPRALAVSGVVCLVCSGVYFLYLPSIRRALRPIYVELGILPQMAAAMPTAGLADTRQD
ncbi:MAG: MFS transporter [Acidobacteriota bacterium]|nr:MFS transporter [Acidobacteriota bacterium]